MKINVNTDIREKYHSGYLRDKSLIDEIVIHGTGGGSTTDGLLNWMMGGERSASYEKGVALFHYLIDRHGDITEIIDPDRWVYHSSSGMHDKKTIGIEHINPSHRNESQYSLEQYRALKELIFDFLMNEYNIKKIVGHGVNKLRYSGKYKRCPGNFDFDEIKKELKKRGISYLNSDEYIYDIGG